jgi:GNAT superfamily N-acetyltransferase
MNSTIPIVNTRPEHTGQIYDVGRMGYGVPLDEDCWDCITAEDVLNHIRLFPEGQFVALDGDHVAGYMCSLLTSRPPDDEPETWFEAVGDKGFNAHDPDGDWLYLGDFAVQPGYRRRGIGTGLYNALFDLIRRRNWRGMYAGAMFKDYTQHSDQMTLEAYADKVRSGEIYDTTVSMQMKRGCQVLGLIEGYTEQAETNDTSILIVWHNPDYHPA